MSDDDRTVPHWPGPDDPPVTAPAPMPTWSTPGRVLIASQEAEIKRLQESLRSWHWIAFWLAVAGSLTWVMVLLRAFHVWPYQ